MKKLQLLTQVIGMVTLMLLALYGALALLGGAGLANAAGSGAAAAAGANIPSSLNYQGFLRDSNGIPVTGIHTITAKIYADFTAGVPLYTTTIPDVAVVDGLFNIVLGDDPPLTADVFADVPRYLGISLDGAAELEPRQRLHAVPWAMTSTTLVTDPTLNGNVSVSGDLDVVGDLTVTGTITSSLGPQFIAITEVINTQTCNAVGWITFTSGLIPVDATAVILQGSAAMSGPDSGNIDNVIWIRADPSADQYALLRGRAAGSGDNIAWSNQGLFPVSNKGTFQYMIGPQGFNGGCDIFLIGYYR